VHAIRGVGYCPPSFTKNILQLHGCGRWRQKGRLIFRVEARKHRKVRSISSVFLPSAFVRSRLADISVVSGPRIILPEHLALLIFVFGHPYSSQTGLLIVESEDLIRCHFLPAVASETASFVFRNKRKDSPSYHRHWNIP
jgi:hypothetical protein